MKRFKKHAKVLILSMLLFTLSSCIKAQAQYGNNKTFLNSEIPGLKIKVDAPVEAKPGENITVTLKLEGQTSVLMKHFTLSIFGFLFGKDKILMAKITDSDFALGVKQYNCTCKVPENIWGITYGEIILTYNATYNAGSGMPVITMPYKNLTVGFAMTSIENVYLEEVKVQLEESERQLKDLRDMLGELNKTFSQCFQANLTLENLALLNRTYWELKQNYTSLQGGLTELDNTRRAAVILAVTTVFFVATTIYLVMRKPKQYW